MSNRKKIELIKKMIDCKQGLLASIRSSNEKGDYTVLMYEINGMENALYAYERNQSIEDRIRVYARGSSKPHIKAYILGMYFVSKVVR